MNKIENIRSLTSGDTGSFGQKASMLGHLSKEFNIASGFALSKQVFDDFIEHNQFRSKIRNLLAIVDTEDDSRLESVANDLQKLILSGELPKELFDAVLEAYYSLSISETAPIEEMAEKEPIVIVRASPIVPGDNLSLLYVQGREKLIKSIVTVFASTFTAESIKMKGRTGYDMPIIFQTMIIPYISGYISEDNDIVIEACFGLSNKQTRFDRYNVNYEMKLKNSTVERQDEAYMLDEDTGKLAKISLPQAKADNAKLNEKQIEVLARLWHRANLCGKKLEFIIDKEHYYFVQVEKMDENKPKESEQETEQEPKKEDDNSLFTIFKSKNSGQSETAPSEAPPVQTPEPQEQPTPEPVPEQPTQQSEPQTEQPTEPEHDMSQESPEPSVTEEPEVVDTGVETPIMSEPEKVDPVPTEQMDQLEGAQDEMTSEMLETAPDSKPLTSDEWLETIRMEHSRALVAYDLAIARALRQKHNEFFDSKPVSFIEMLDNLSQKISVPYAEQIKGVHTMRNKFLRDHETIGIDELKVAYSITENFLKEFK